MTQRRTPRGTPAGGEFSGQQRSEADVSLETSAGGSVDVPPAMLDCPNPNCYNGHEVDETGSSVGRCQTHCENGQTPNPASSENRMYHPEDTRPPAERIGLPMRQPRRWANPAPAVEETGTDGVYQTVWYDSDGSQDSGDRGKPARMGWRNEDKSLVFAEYKMNGRLHRRPQDGPAVVQYDGQGRLAYEGYYVLGELTEPYPGGPMEVTWLPDEGTPFSKRFKDRKEWYDEDGEVVRVDNYEEEAF